MIARNHEKGLAIAQELEKHNAGFIDFTVDMHMILSDKNGRETNRDLHIQTLETKYDGDKRLCIFKNPGDVKGTVFLTFTHKVGNDDQWIYLPALKRVKRINARNKATSFMGSEFSYEDLTSHEVEKYTYKWIRDELYNGNNCSVVEFYPIDTKNSGYIKKVYWINQKENRVEKIDFYDRKNSLLKTLIVKKYKIYMKKYWKPDEMLMTNHQSSKKTVIFWSNYKFNTGLKENNFSQHMLKRIK